MMKHTQQQQLLSNMEASPIDSITLRGRRITKAKEDIPATGLTALIRLCVHYRTTELLDANEQSSIHKRRAE